MRHLHLNEAAAVANESHGSYGAAYCIIFVLNPDEGWGLRHSIQICTHNHKYACTQAQCQTIHTYTYYVLRLRVGYR